VSSCLGINFQCMA